MYHICRNERAEARQRLIAETFLRMLEKQEFHTIQITALAQAAGIPRKAFYRFFDAKEDIISFYVEDMMLSLLGQMNENTGSRATSVRNCALFFRFWTERPAVLTVLCRPDTFGHFWIALMRILLEQRVLNLVLTPDAPVQDPELATAFATSNLIHLLLYWNYHGRKETPEELGALFYDSLTRPLLPTANR